VVDAETGAGIVGAEVFVAGSDGTFGFAGARGHADTARAGAEGRFELHNGMERAWSDSPPHVLIVTASGYVKDSFRMHENRLDVTLRLVRDAGMDVACSGQGRGTLHSVDGRVRVDSTSLEEHRLRRGDYVLALDGVSTDGLGDVGLGRLIGERAGHEVLLTVRSKRDGGEEAARDVRFVAERCSFGVYAAQSSAEWGE
jgi:hypothetical protein